MTQQDWTKNPDGIYEQEISMIPLIECGTEYFNFDQAEVQANGIDSFLCPQEIKYVLQGNSIASSFRFFDLNITKCTNGTIEDVTWQSEEDIEEALMGAELNIALVNSYFDFEDYNKPIQTYLDDRFKYNLVSDIERFITIYVQENEAETNDNYFQYSSDGKSSDFVSVNRVDKELRDAGDSSSLVMSTRFVKDYNYDSYERQVFSAFELIGSLGGLFEIFTILGGALVGTFGNMLFNYSIIKSLYHVDTLKPKSQKVDDIFTKVEALNDTHKQMNSPNITIIEESKTARKRFALPINWHTTNSSNDLNAKDELK